MGGQEDVLDDVMMPVVPTLMWRRVRNLKRSVGCFRTPARLVVFESDDWGMDAIRSEQVFRELTAHGVIDRADRFNKCSRETLEDMDLLYGVLGDCCDKRGRPAVITTNFVMANPDFEAIERSGYNEYFWIGIDEVDKRPSQGPLIAKYKEGIGRGVIYPQYHGRDHFSTESWLKALRDGDSVARTGFCCGVPMSSSSRFLESEYMERRGGRLTLLSSAAIDAKTCAGTSIFGHTFGFRSLSSIPPFYVWDHQVEESLSRRGVRCMQAASHRHMPSNTDGELVCRPGILGEQSTSGMVYLVRNCQFEPSRDGEAAVEVCLRGVEVAFSRGYPAIVDTHRVNYVGGVDPVMRDANLTLLRTLLRAITNRFHGVQFATSAELATGLLCGDGNSREAGESNVHFPRAGGPRRVLWAGRERLAWWLERRFLKGEGVSDANVIPYGD